jgi:hypothetical protein
MEDIIYGEFIYYNRQNINIDIDENGIYNITLTCEENEDDNDTNFIINLNEHMIKIYSLHRCSDDKSGSNILNSIIQIGTKLKIINFITLFDQSKKCNISLYILSILRFGESWYNRFHFYEDDHDNNKIYNAQIINYTFKQYFEMYPNYKSYFLQNNILRYIDEDLTITENVNNLYNLYKNDCNETNPLYLIVLFFKNKLKYNFRLTLHLQRNYGGTNKLQTNYKQITNKLQTNYKQITNKLQTNYKQITNKLHTNYTQSTNKLQTNYTQSTNKLQTKYKNVNTYSNEKQEKTDKHKIINTILNEN